jgi:hypothetical protein
MMKKIHFCKATDLYDCGTATFGIAKGNIQSVLTLVIRDPVGRRGNNHTFYGDVPGADPGFCVRGDESRREVWGPLNISSGHRAEPW